MIKSFSVQVDLGHSTFRSLNYDKTHAKKTNLLKSQLPLKRQKFLLLFGIATEV